MRVRDRGGARADLSVTGLDRPVVVFGDEPARPSQHKRRLGLALALLVAVGLGAGWWLATSGDEQVAAQPAAQAPAPAAVDVPPVLALRVAAPPAVVAGQPARFVVSYTDGEGIFSGGIEDWGDIGVGSTKQAACRAGAPVAAALTGSYPASHTWSKAGSYPATFSVTTYTCSNGQATQETRSTALTVVVAAR